MLHRKSEKGLTLLELLITIIIVTMMGLAIMSSMIFSIYARQHVLEQNGAMRAAADLMETTKKTRFDKLTSRVFNDVVIDNRGTPDTDDDIVGSGTLEFFDRNGNQVATGGASLPLNLSMVEAVVTVQWSPAGRADSDQEIELRTYLAP